MAVYLHSTKERVRSNFRALGEQLNGIDLIPGVNSVRRSKRKWFKRYISYAVSHRRFQRSSGNTRAILKCIAYTQYIRIYQADSKDVVPSDVGLMCTTMHLFCCRCNVLLAYNTRGLVQCRLWLDVHLLIFRQFPVDVPCVYNCIAFHFITCKQMTRDRAFHLELISSVFLQT